MSTEIRRLQDALREVVAAMRTKGQFVSHPLGVDRDAVWLSVVEDWADELEALASPPGQEAPLVKEEEDLSRVDRSTPSQGLDLPRKPQREGSQR